MIDRELVERPERALQLEQKDNTVFIVAGKLALESIGDKILVLVDKFKSGYECKDCDETGIFKTCECERAGHAGQNRLGGFCKYCSGFYESKRGLSCSTCKGTGATVILPENARSIPTSGVVVSTGPDCKVRRIGERVLFGAHTGYYLPFKGAAKIRSMREDEPLCLIYAVDNNYTVDEFIQIEENQK